MIKDKYTVSETLKGCWNCYEQQNIENETCSYCGEAKFYPVEKLVLSKEDQGELNVLMGLLEDPNFFG
jgi:hypothetical protein